MGIPKNGLHGAYNRAELVVELGQWEVQSAIKDGRLLPFCRNVVVDAREATEILTRAAASLHLGGQDAVLTGHTALALRGFSAADTSPIEVLLPSGVRRRHPADVVIRPGTVEDRDVIDVDGLDTLVADAALTEVLCRGTRRAGIACADQVLATVSSEDRPRLRAGIARRIWQRADRTGRRKGLAMLDLATGLADSPPESWMLLALVDGGLPVPEQQVPVTDISGRVIYLLDFAWPGPRIALEYDGFAAHEHHAAYDAARDEDLRRRGWIVIRATAADLRDPSQLIAKIKAAFRMRRFAA